MISRDRRNQLEDERSDTPNTRASAHRSILLTDQAGKQVILRLFIQSNGDNSPLLPAHPMCAFQDIFIFSFLTLLSSPSIVRPLVILPFASTQSSRNSVPVGTKGTLSVPASLETTGLGKHFCPASNPTNACAEGKGVR